MKPNEFDSVEQRRAIERAVAGQRDSIERGNWMTLAQIEAKFQLWPMKHDPMRRLAAVGHFPRPVAVIDGEPLWALSQILKCCDTAEARERLQRRYEEYEHGGVDCPRWQD